MFEGFLYAEQDLTDLSWLRMLHKELIDYQIAHNSKRRDHSFSSIEKAEERVGKCIRNRLTRSHECMSSRCPAAMVPRRFLDQYEYIDSDDNTISPLRLETREKIMDSDVVQRTQRCGFENFRLHYTMLHNVAQFIQCCIC